MTTEKIVCKAGGHSHLMASGRLNGIRYIEAGHGSTDVHVVATEV